MDYRVTIKTNSLIDYDFWLLQSNKISHLILPEKMRIDEFIDMVATCVNIMYFYRDLGFTKYEISTPTVDKLHIIMLDRNEKILREYDYFKNSDFVIEQIENGVSIGNFQLTNILNKLVGDFMFKYKFTDMVFIESTM